MEVKMSIVIPVYNAERFITQCIESLLNQTLKECEFIFVNDGSTDRSKNMIESFINQDSRIILLNQKNKGVSKARNVGLKKASGEYIGFVDADDFVKNDMFEVMYNTAKNYEADIVFSNLVGDFEGKRFHLSFPFLKNTTLDQKYIRRELIPYLIKSDNFNSVCTKIYKNKLIKQGNMEFLEKVGLGEDGIFNIHFLSNVYKAFYLDYSGYHYREVSGSATRDILSKDYFQQAIDVYKSNLVDRHIVSYDNQYIQKLKAIKLIRAVMAYVYLYFTPTKEMSFKRRYRYIKEMLENNFVREAIPAFYDVSFEELGRYEKVILNYIYKKAAFRLYCATTYSRLRNRNRGRSKI